MARANYDNWRSKNSFTDWERACLLANVEPTQGLTQDELSRVSLQLEWIEGLRGLKVAITEAALFKKLLTL